MTTETKAFINLLIDRLQDQTIMQKRINILTSENERLKNAVYHLNNEAKKDVKVFIGINQAFSEIDCEGNDNTLNTISKIMQEHNSSHDF